MQYRIVIIVCAFMLDWMFGDPQNRYHPICLIGNGISRMEKAIRAHLPKSAKAEKIGGILLVVSVLLITGGVAGGLLMLAYRLWVPAGVLTEVVCCYFMLAARSLREESMKVYDAFSRGDVEGARYAVSMIVGRDTKMLSAEGIQKAAVETVAENTSDGEIAPLFYMALFGGMGAVLYKAVNTMDSMVAYKNETYLHFGWAAAKLDDAANWIPSRLAALFMVAAAWCLERKYPVFSGKGAFRIWRRDRRNHKSPNSAQTEAACAGALQVQLAGPAWYFGDYYDKPTIGDAVRAVEAEDIRRANWLLAGTSVLFWLVVSGCVLAANIL